jgi:hypothetical protein
VDPLVKASACGVRWLPKPSGIVLLGAFMLRAAGAVGNAAPGLPAACGAPDVKPWNDHGLERMTVTSPCRRGDLVRAEYDSALQQTAFFSDDGVAHLAVALTGAPGPITLRYQDETTSAVEIEAGSPATALRVTLQWELPVDLNLHVVEPGGRVNEKGDAAVGHAPEQFGFAGRIDLQDDGKGSGPFQESYVFPDRLQRPTDVFTIYVEDASRGREPAEPHCGKGRLAIIRFSLVIADRGKVSKRPFTLTPADCGQPLDDRTYYFKPRL